MVVNNFELERENPSDLSVKDYKNITNFEESKNLLPDTIFHIAYPYKFHKLFLIL